jgi:transposase-like protein
MSKADNPFRYFHSSPDIIRIVVMLYVRHPLSLRNVEDLLFERGLRPVSRDGAAMVESFRSAVRSRYPPPATEPDERLPALAVAS